MEQVVLNIVDLLALISAALYVETTPVWRDVYMVAT